MADNGVTISEKEIERRARDLLLGGSVAISPPMELDPEEPRTGIGTGIGTGTAGREEQKEKEKPSEQARESKPERKIPTGVPKPKPESQSQPSDQPFGEYERFKEEGKKQHASGKYAEALEKYKQCLKALDDARRTKAGSGPTFERDWLVRKAIAHNNIAVCYKQLQDMHAVVGHATDVITSNVPDAAILAKAYALRALAFESTDKLKLALEDWQKVIELQPENPEVRIALARIQAATRTETAQHTAAGIESTLKQLELHKQRGNDLFKASTMSRISSRGLRERTKGIHEWD
jgi:tetratricopeptide (TPR) repeat protein